MLALVKALDGTMEWKWGNYLLGFVEQIVVVGDGKNDYYCVDGKVVDCLKMKQEVYDDEDIQQNIVVVDGGEKEGLLLTVVVGEVPLSLFEHPEQREKCDFIG